VFTGGLTEIGNRDPPIRIGSSDEVAEVASCDAVTRGEILQEEIKTHGYIPRPALGGRVGSLCRLVGMKGEEHQGQMPPPSYVASDPQATHQAGWAHPDATLVPQMAAAPVQGLPEGWHSAAGWPQMEAWGFSATHGSWPHHPAPMGGGYAMQQPMHPYGGLAPSMGYPQQPLSSGPMPQLPPQPQPYQGGVIFLCDQRTEEECLQRCLFALPATQMQIVRAIVPEATLLFLFNVRARQMLGVFRAVSWPQQNIEPHAFADESAAGTSRFPLQVRTARARARASRCAFATC
jgi:hypothetical protein